MQGIERSRSARGRVVFDGPPFAGASWNARIVSRVGEGIPWPIFHKACPPMPPDPSSSTGPVSIATRAGNWHPERFPTPRENRRYGNNRKPRPILLPRCAHWSRVQSVRSAIRSTVRCTTRSPRFRCRSTVRRHCSVSTPANRTVRIAIYCAPVREIG